ncbi:hypothetical protein DW2_03854 [Thioclava atlantica]|uniref:DUF2029 domain-containing protein n=1 Tax=Thioclava atlantica TaxID=1317124 RepID=A0A085U0B6_9RHOB|nr:hypothetical protein DW2_03854 [Thioclava atlantica]
MRGRGSVLLFSGVFFLFAAIAVIGYVSANPHACYGAGDCVHYTAMTEAFRAWTPTTIPFPFNTRVLAPFLASLFPYEITDSFLILNLICVILFLVFLALIIWELELGSVDYLLIGLWFLLHPSGFPTYYANPKLVDPLAYAIFALVILCYIKNWRFFLVISLIAGLLTKQTFLVLALLITLADLMFSSKVRFAKDFDCDAKRNFCFFVGIEKRTVYFLIGLYFAIYLTLDFLKAVEKEAFPLPFYPAPSSLGTIIHFLKESLREPFRIIVWFGSIFSATGFFLVYVYPAKRALQFALKSKVAFFLFIGSLAFLVLGLLGGSDMTRIIFNGNLLILLFVSLLAKAGTFSKTFHFAAVTLSAAMMLLYTHFFPTAFEYAYYVGHDVSGISIFLMIMSLFSLMLVFARHHLLDEAQ